MLFFFFTFMPFIELCKICSVIVPNIYIYIFWCHSKTFWTISLKFTFLLSKMAQKTFTITIHSFGLSCQWWSNSILGACMTLNAPFRRRSSRQAVLDLYTGKDMHVCTDPHTHTFLSTRLGATLHHRNSWGISALPRRQMKLVGIVVTEWPLWESYNVVLHPLCTAWGGKSCLEGWFTGLQGCCYPPPCPRHGGMLAKKEWLTDYKAKGVWPLWSSDAHAHLIPVPMADFM